MRGSRGFAMGIAAFFVLMVVVQLNIPQQFSWTPTFLPADKNPFGCYVFDSVMSRSLPRGYRVTDKTLSQLSREKARQNVLVITDELKPDSADIAAIRRITARGGRVMLVGTNLYYGVDSLLIKAFGASPEGFTSFRINLLREGLRTDAGSTRTMIEWCTDDDVYQAVCYAEYAMMTDNKIKTDSLRDVSVLASARLSGKHNKGKIPVAVTCKAGQGEVVIVSTPLLFTNYGVLDGHTHGYILRLMSRIADAPVTRTLAYMPLPEGVADGEQSPLRFFLSRPPLRTATYLALLFVVLFMVFGARRRQRVIPIIAPPRNHSLEFTQLIGTLHFHKRNHSDLVKRKFALFCDDLRRLLMVDVTDRTADDSNFDTIARHTGLPREEVETMLTDIRRVADGELVATEYGMRMYIDNMNKIMKEME